MGGRTWTTCLQRRTSCYTGLALLAAGSKRCQCCASSSLLDHDVMMSVADWHSNFARQGVPPHANGAALVIALGPLLGGRSNSLAHLIWARACESRSTVRAEMHLRRARALADAEGDQELAAIADEAFNSLLSRFHIQVPRTASPPAAELNVRTVGLVESRTRTLYESGRYLDALALLDQIVPFAVEYGLEEELMRSLQLRGLIHDHLSHYAQAEDDFREAARLARRLGDAGRQFDAQTNLAASYVKRGQPLRALPAFRAILRDADASGRLNHRVAARNNLALAYARSGDHQSARDVYLQAWHLMSENTDNGSALITLPGLASAYQDLGDEQSRRQVSERMRRMWADDGDEQALIHYLVSDMADFADPQMHQLGGQVEQALRSRGDVLLAGSLARLLAAADRQRGDDRAALQRLDSFLATFASNRSSLAVCVYAELAAAVIERETARGAAAAFRLRSAVASVEQRLVDVEGPEGDWLIDAARPLYLALVDLLLEEDSEEALSEAFWLHEACRPLTLTSTLSASRREHALVSGGDRRVAGAAQVHAALTTGRGRTTAVISFAETKQQVGAFVLTSDAPGVTWVPLMVTAAELNAAADELSLAFNGDQTRFPPRAALAAANLALVDLTVTEDVLARLGHCLTALGTTDVVCVVPSTSMEGLPLHAMPGLGGARVVERAAVVVQPSLSSLVATSALPPLALGRRAVFVAGTAATQDGHPEFFEDDARVFEGVPASVTAISGTQATPAAVLDGVRRHDIAHLSCHGFVDTQDPLGSGLLLSDGTQRPSRRTQDVPVQKRAEFQLTARDLVQQSLHLDLVTLRACSTARRAAVAAKEENSTLTRALQAAGCRTVISTLWNVDQQTSLALIQSFYAGYLAEGLPAGDAMASAQRKLIASGEPYSHLYHWGAYIVSGDWRGLVDAQE